MDNLTTVALIVIICSIVVFFSQEFSDFFKKIYAIPGVKLFAPLIFATVIVVYYSAWLFLGAMTLQRLLLELSHTLTRLLSFSGAGYLVNCLLLICLTYLPVLAINYWVKRKSYLPFKHAYLVNTILWLIMVLLITTG